VLNASGAYQDETPGMYHPIGALTYFNNYITLIQTPFCGIPGCAHLDESCFARSGDGVRFARRYVAGSNLYRIQSYDPPFAPNEFFKLEKWDFDGSGYELIFDFPGRVVISEVVLTDDKALYFDIGNWAEAQDHPALTLAANETVLVRYDMASGEATKIRDMDHRILFGVADNELILWIAPEAEGEPAGMAAYSITTDEERILPTPPDKVQEYYKKSFAPVYKGCFYYTETNRETGTASLKRYVLTTGKTEEVTVLNATALRSHEIVDNEVRVVAFFEDKTRATYYINVETKEVRVAPLTYIYQDEVKPCEIVGTWQGNYIIQIGAFIEPFEYMPGFFVNNDRPIYAQISKEDFWAGKPNYTEMQMWR